MVDKCQFCGKLPKQVWYEEVIVFECGTLSNDPEPRTMQCWRGWVKKLKGQIRDLEVYNFPGLDRFEKP
jgi:hypothetical protein